MSVVVSCDSRLHRISVTAQSFFRGLLGFQNIVVVATRLKREASSCLISKCFILFQMFVEEQVRTVAARNLDHSRSLEFNLGSECLGIC